VKSIVRPEFGHARAVVNNFNVGRRATKYLRVTILEERVGRCRIGDPARPHSPLRPLARPTQHLKHALNRLVAALVRAKRGRPGHLPFRGGLVLTPSTCARAGEALFETPQSSTATKIATGSDRSLCFSLSSSAAYCFQRKYSRRPRNTSPEHRSDLGRAQRRSPVEIRHAPKIRRLNCTIQQSKM